jgi:Uma2 family endonuclease
MGEANSAPPRFRSHHLDAFPLDDGKRYEIIDGELYISRQPHLNHQRVCHRLAVRLQQWVDQFGEGEVIPAPGLVFADDDDVAPDLIWMSSSRSVAIVQLDGKLHAAPELIVEVLSPGSANEKRDREAKLMLYSRRGVDEYWIVDWQERQVKIFRRQDDRLVLAATLAEFDRLITPILPGLILTVGDVFTGVG